MSLLALVLLTIFLTEVISNVAAAALMVPVALSMAQGLAVSPMPMLMSVMIAASASFLSQLGTRPISWSMAQVDIDLAIMPDWAFR